MNKETILSILAAAGISLVVNTTAVATEITNIEKLKESIISNEYSFNIDFINNNEEGDIYPKFNAGCANLGCH